MSAGRALARSDLLCLFVADFETHSSKRISETGAEKYFSVNIRRTVQSIIPGGSLGCGTIPFGGPSIPVPSGLSGAVSGDAASAVCIDRGGLRRPA